MVTVHCITRRLDTPSYSTSNANGNLSFVMKGYELLARDCFGRSELTSKLGRWLSRMAMNHQ